MKSTFVSIIPAVLIALLMHSVTLASGAPVASVTVSPLVKALDLDGDGTLSGDELSSLPDGWKDLDGDSSGALEAGEIAATSPLLRLLDENHDGTLAGEEYASLPDALKQLDGDGSETIGPSELAGSGGSGDWNDLFLCVVYAAVALLFSSLCSVAEAVLLSISPSYVANLQKEGSKSAGRIKSVKTNVDRSLAAILTLNTIAHTIGSGGAGAYAAKFWGDGAVGIAMIVLTLLILFVSEIIPKTIGAVYWRGLAPITARFIQFLNLILYPFIFVSELITKWLTGGHSHHAFSP